MRLAVILSIAGLVTLPAFSYGQDQTKADNTKINQRDRSTAATTADQQKENKSDRELAKQIRRAIVQDKSLSTYAHNIKVVSENGTVTLKGPVRSEEEKKAIEAKAAEIAGKNMNSEISVVPNSKTQSQR
jgi:hyperosmotically inducible protein